MCYKPGTLAKWESLYRRGGIDALCQKFVLTAAGRAYSRMSQWMRMLVTDGTLNVSGSTINTDAKGGAGVFAYKNGTVNISEGVLRDFYSVSICLKAVFGILMFCKQ